jgi:hypothetical protein
MSEKGEFDPFVGCCCGLDIRRKEIVTTVEDEGMDIQPYDEILDGIEGMAVGTGCCPCGDGEYWRLLETGNKRA